MELLIFELTKMRTLKLPLRPYFVAKLLPYAGGLDDTQAEALVLPSVSTPPPHGDGFCPGRGCTHNPT